MKVIELTLTKSPGESGPSEVSKVDRPLLTRYFFYKSKKNFITNNRWPSIEDIEDDDEEIEEELEPIEEDDFSRRMASYPHSGLLHLSHK